MKIPNENDWQGIAEDLDYQNAYKNFFGKSIEEAQELFLEGTLCYHEDLMWMPMIPFQYYIHAYINYLLSDSSKEDTDYASCFLGLIEFLLEHEGLEYLGSAQTQVYETVKFILNHGEWFDWDEKNYGSLQTRAEKILNFH